MRVEAIGWREGCHITSHTSTSITSQYSNISSVDRCWRCPHRSISSEFDRIGFRDQMLLWILLRLLLLLLLFLLLFSRLRRNEGSWPLIQRSVRCDCVSVRLKRWVQVGPIWAGRERSCLNCQHLLSTWGRDEGSSVGQNTGRLRLWVYRTIRSVWMRVSGIIVTLMCVLSSLSLLFRNTSV